MPTEMVQLRRNRPNTNVFTDVLMGFFCATYGACGIYLICTGSILIGIMALVIVGLVLTVVHLYQRSEAHRREKQLIEAVFIQQTEDRNAA